MDASVYKSMAENDARHWWYCARRDILSDYLSRYAELPERARILEIGCGTGHNLEMLGAFGEIDAIEINEGAAKFAATRLGKPVGSAPLPDLPGMEPARYDLVAILDVLEHIEADVAALRAIKRLLKPGGKILITVPAHQWMWGSHDVANHHKRRYSKRTLRAALAAAGLEWRKLRWFNSILFPLAVAERLWGRISGKRGGDEKTPFAPLNAVLKAVFKFERHLVGRVPLPPGLSIIVLASPA